MPFGFKPIEGVAQAAPFFLCLRELFAAG